MKIKSVFLLTSLLVGCNTDTDLRKPDWLYINFCKAPTSPDSRKSTETVSSHLSDLLNEGLMKLDDEGNIVPAQAERVEISEDGLIYTFHLKETFWSNGEPVTAHDFSASWKKCLSPNFPSPTAYCFYPIKNAELAKQGLISIDQVAIEEVSPKCLRVTLEHPTSTFLSLMCSSFAYPIRYKEDNDSEPTSLLCSGPFYITHWGVRKKQNKIILKRNPYYKSDNLSLKGIEISLIEDQNTVYELFKKGDLDFIGGMYSPITPTTFETMPEDTLDKLISAPAVSVTVCNFNTRRFPLNNLNIRKAFSLGIDRELLATTFKKQNLTPAYSIIPNGVKNFSHSPFSREARQMAIKYFENGLQELGLTKQKFPKLKLLYPRSFENIIVQKIVQILQQNWQELLGVDVLLETYDLKTMLAILAKQEFDLALILWSANYPHPLSFLERFLSHDNPKNYSGWENPGFQKSLQEAYYAKTKIDESRSIIDAESILAEDVPVTPIVFWNALILPEERIEGLKMNRNGSVCLDSVKTKPPGV